MTIDYVGGRYRPSPALMDAHDAAWQCIGAPGTWWAGAERRAIVAEARNALRCTLCDARRNAVSPNDVPGQHDACTELDAPAVDATHRIVSDPGRLTRAWFKRLIASGLERTRYVELVGVLATSVVIDTLHRAFGRRIPELPVAKSGAPRAATVAGLVDEGAWVPIVPRTSDEASATGLPAVPNITRALSMVPSAFELFFLAFRPHYRLQGLDFAIGRPQIEFVASRVSALNRCFY